MNTSHLRLAVLAFTAFCFSAVAAPIQDSVFVKLGPKSFHDGDVIQIEDVRSTSPNLEPGDTLTVKGRYRLDSRESASLQLHLTQIGGDGLEEIDSPQIVEAVRGWHAFEATITVKHRGLLHLTFYHADTGKPFGGVYFGTDEQMKDTDRRLVAHYLAEP